MHSDPRLQGLRLGSQLVHFVTGESRGEAHPWLPSTSRAGRRRLGAHRGVFRGAKFKVIKEFEHHIEEEEGEMFKQAKQVFDEEELAQLGESSAA
jgi:hypothetical protein